MAETRPPTRDSGLRYVVSADGTRIAYERFGSGPPVILVGGALNDRRGRASGVALARLLAPTLTAYAYDRRGRGESRTSRAATLADEIADLRALVEAAGGSATLFGMSSGGALVIAAAAAGVPATRIALYEPPFSVDAAAEARAKAYDARLRELVDAADNDGALALFMGIVGMPPAAVEGMRKGPAWPAMTPLAPTLVDDSAALDNASGGAVPVAAIKKIAAPILAIAGELGAPPLRQSAERVAAAARQGSFRLLPGQTHDVAPEVLAPVLIEFLVGE